MCFDYDEELSPWEDQEHVVGKNDKVQDEDSPHANSHNEKPFINTEDEKAQCG